MLNEVLNSCLKIFTDHISRFVEKNNLFVRAHTVSGGNGNFSFSYKVRILILQSQLKKNVILNIGLLVEINNRMNYGKGTKWLSGVIAGNRFFDGFLHLLFPASCIICSGELLKTEKNCCSVCFSELAYTYFEKAEEPTVLDQLFWGRVPVFMTYSLLYYEKNNNVKPILQALKYKNRPDIGVFFGKMLGNYLKTNPGFSSVEVLIPVPVHLKKKYIRGYNQSEKLAEGIAAAWKVGIDRKVVSKKKHTKSQTMLGRFKRWDNVEHLFHVGEEIHRYRHIALVDDVITTGATLEAIMQSIRIISPDIKISVISLAVTK